MNLVRFRPWTLADLMQRDFERFGGRPHLRDTAGMPAREWAPAVDIVEEQDRFVLRADVPGVLPEDIDISMEDGILSITGKRQTERPAQPEGVQRFERVSGTFCRRFTLPDTADADSISARTSNGILEVAIPKLPEVQPRRITVEAA